MLVYWILAAALLGLVGGWSARDWKADADEKERLGEQNRVEARARDKVDWSATTYEKGRAAAETRERVIVKEVERVVQKPVYLQSCFDDDGLRIVADDVAAANARGQPAPALPAASAP